MNFKTGVFILFTFLSVIGCCPTNEVTVKETSQGAYGGIGEDFATSIIPAGNGTYFITGGFYAESINHLIFRHFEDFNRFPYYFRSVIPNIPANLIELDNSMIAVASNYGKDSPRMCLFNNKSLSKTDLKYDNLFTYRADSANIFRIKEIKKATDGGILAVGEYERINSKSGLDIIVCKFDPTGEEVIWARTIGDEDYNSGTTIESTPGGGCIIAGITALNAGGSPDIMLVTLNAEGEILKGSKIYSPKDNFEPKLYKNKTGFYLTFNSISGTESDFTVLRLSEGGNFLTGATFGGPRETKVNGGIVNPDESITLTGSVNTYMGYGNDVLLTKIDNQLKIQWSNSFGGCGIDVGNSVCKSDKGGYWIAGYFSSKSSPNIYVLKTDEQGKGNLNDIYIDLKTFPLQIDQSPSGFSSTIISVNSAQEQNPLLVKATLQPPSVEDQPRERRSCQ